MLTKQFKVSKNDLHKAKQREIFEKYLGSDASPAPAMDPRLRLGQTEVFREYTADGRLVRGPTELKVATKYEEDVYINNHTEVWGSFYRKSKTKVGCLSLLTLLCY